MTVIDSSGWIEYFRGTPLGEQYATHLTEGEVIVPAVVIYEVYKFVRREIGEEAALRALSRLRGEHVVAVDDMMAVTAAHLSVECRLAMADAMIYATALAYDAAIVTSDEDLGRQPGAVYYPTVAPTTPPGAEPATG